MDISAIILAKNEEKNIEDCIRCIKKLCIEVLVINDDSSDDTASIAKKMGAKVINHRLNSNFSQQRNFAMTQAKGDWILFIDADERVSLELAKEIHNTINQPEANAYYIKRLDFMWGKFLKHGETGKLYLLRLAKKNSGLWVGAVHENWLTQGRTAELINPILHYPHITTEEFLKEINIYSTIRSEELYKQHARTSWLKIVFYPKIKFLQNYILRRGFLDGTAGFVFAMLMSFHSFLVRGKLWQLQQNPLKKK